MEVIKVINPELGWDNVVCVADSMQSAAFYLECETVKEFEDLIEEDQYRIETINIETLPKGCKTLKEAVEKYW